MNKLKGSIIPLKNDVRSTIIEYLKKAMDKKIIDAVISPIRVPSGDAYSYVLIKDKKLLEKSNPIPPVMFVQGSKAISSVTRMGAGKLKIAAILRPCETRATIELAKMAQAKLDNIILISMDCPGVIPTKTFLDNPDKSIEILQRVD